MTGHLKEKPFISSSDSMEIAILRISTRNLFLVLTVILIAFNNVSNSTTCIKVEHSEIINIGGSRREVTINKCVSISSAYAIKSQVVRQPIQPIFQVEALCCCKVTDSIDRHTHIGDAQVNYKEILSCGCGFCESE